MANFFRSSSKTSESSSSSSSQNPNHLLKEEINLVDVKQSIDNWKIPKHPTKDVYREPWWNFSSDYTIKTVEQTIPLNSEYGEIHLLPYEDINKLKYKYNYLHLGLVQVAAKPLTREGLDTSVLLCLRDARHLDFNNSILGMVESSLCGGPVYFDCFPNFPVSLVDPHVRSTLTLNVKVANSSGAFKTMSKGTISVVILYRIQYKAMNSVFKGSGSLKTSKIGETVLFQTDLARSRMFIPRSISWDGVTIPEHWMQPKAVPTEAVQNTVRSFNAGSAQIKFGRCQS